MTSFRFDSVLVPTDGSQGARKALDCAVALCQRLGSELTILGVEGRLPAYAASLGEVDEVKQEKDAFFARVLDEAAALAQALGVSARTDRVAGPAADMIASYARAHGADLIVIGHRGHFLGDYLIGSTADRVAHHAHCPVMVLR